MTAQALKALKLAIAHWQRLASGKRDDRETTSPQHCALCQEFQKPYSGDPCRECPVYHKTGKSGCVGTPYSKCSSARMAYGLDSTQFRAAAKKELAFLKSLLPGKGKL